MEIEQKYELLLATVKVISSNTTLTEELTVTEALRNLKIIHRLTSATIELVQEKE